MGGDGGSICRRAEMVRTRSKAPVMDTSPLTEALWNHCYISGEPLIEPIVSCSHGHLYNKEAILKHLIQQSHRLGDNDHSIDSSPSHSPSSIIPHIKSIRDLVDLKMTRNRDHCHLYSSSSSSSSHQPSSSSSSFICPITKREMNGKCTFVYLRGCGCVMSESVFLTSGSSHHYQILECPNCSAKRVSNDIVIINDKNRTEEKKQQYQQQMKSSEKSSLSPSSLPLSSQNTDTTSQASDIIKGNQGLYANTFHRYP